MQAFNHTQGFNQALAEFTPISLKKINDVSLMKRTDTKFIVHSQDLLKILGNLKSEYQILEIANKRLMTYTSLYFDTQNEDLYFNHHNKRVNRIKVRMRKYIDSSLSFLEIKTKNNKGSTDKKRIPIPDLSNSLSHDQKEFIAKITQQKLDLSPSISNSFNRITLVNKEHCERLTIDLNLSFTKPHETTFTAPHPNIAIIEVKQERYNRASPCMQVLKKMNIHEMSLSKYCLGIINHSPSIKQNLFKQKLRQINKIGVASWNS